LRRVAGADDVIEENLRLMVWRERWRSKRPFHCRQGSEEAMVVAIPCDELNPPSLQSEALRNIRDHAPETRSRWSLGGSFVNLGSWLDRAGGEINK
jgi:hypothetical protein